MSQIWGVSRQSAFGLVAAVRPGGVAGGIERSRTAVRTPALEDKVSDGLREGPRQPGRSGQVPPRADGLPPAAAGIQPN